MNRSLAWWDINIGTPDVKVASCMPNVMTMPKLLKLGCSNLKVDSSPIALLRKEEPEN